MTFWCMCFIKLFMLLFGMLRSLSCDIGHSCTVPLTHVIMVMRGFNSHPLFFSASMNRLYLRCFLSNAFSEYRLW